MLCLKKVYRDELLQLAILLSLLRVDRRSSLGYDYSVPAVGVGIDDIQGWEQSHSFVRSHIEIHPKSLDSILINHEQRVFEDLNSLGRYQRLTSPQDVTAYLLNVDSNECSNGDDTNTSSNIFNETETVSRTLAVDISSNASNQSESDTNVETNSCASDCLNGTLFTSDESLFKEVEEFHTDEFLNDLAILKGEPRSADELSQEDMDLIEVLWKQDVDMGFTMEALQPVDLPPAAKPPLTAPHADTKPADKIPDIDDWESLPHTIDGETGEAGDYVLKGGINVTSLSVDEPPSALLDQSDFSLEQAFQLVCLDESELCSTGEYNSGIEKAIKDTKPDDEASGLDAVEDLELLAEMIQTPQYHARPYQGRMPYVRTMSMEQRWQDLANLLSLPEPPYHPHHHHHHHHHYPHHPHHHGAGALSDGALLHNASLAPPAVPDTTYPPPPPQLSSGAGSNIGSAVATSLSLTNSSEPMPGDHPTVNFKIESPHDMMYYQNGTVEMNHTTDGFLSSILNDEDLQLMDMAMNEGMYTMRMMEGASSQSAVPERGTDSDSAVSSMGSERVSSDTEWMETNSDSGHTPADHITTDYHGKARWYDYSYNGRQHSSEGNTSDRLPQPSVAQKKHHMYGKRYFQEQGAASSSNHSMMMSSPSTPSSVKFDFNSSDSGSILTLQQEMTSIKSRPETKYSCSVEFSRHLHSSVRPTAEHVMHNHSYHIPPDQIGAMQRPLARDKQKGRRSDEEPLTRDEKKARALSIPIPVHEIINLPMDEFNERLSKYDLSESQLSLIRDIRRRGKNKVAAQNCRKRKLDQIMSLADEVKQMRDRKHRLVRERDFLVAETQRMKNKYTQLYRHIFQALRDSEGNPYSPYEWSLQQSAEGSVLLVPRNNGSVTDSDQRHKNKETDPRKP